MVKFGLLYLTDYHPEVHGTYITYYEQMLEQIVTAETRASTGSGLPNTVSHVLRSGTLPCLWPPLHG